MKRHSIAILVSAGLMFLFASAAWAQQAPAAATPSRARGISMHMPPKRVADLGSDQWGLVVSLVPQVRVLPSEANLGGLTVSCAVPAGLGL